MDTDSDGRLLIPIPICKIPLRIHNTDYYCIPNGWTKGILHAGVCSNTKCGLGKMLRHPSP